MEEWNFIFNNESSLDYLTVSKLPSIFKAQKDITKIEIDGRDGFLTQDDGSYKGIIKTVECWVKDLSYIDYLCNWLTGSSDVIFSNEPDRVYKATIINQIQFDVVARDFHTFLIQFDCQPHKYAIDNNTIVLTSSGNVFNPAPTFSKPLIKIYGSGAINLTINGNVIKLTNISGYVTINSEMMDCYKDLQLMNNYMIGDFPSLISGNNIISWTGTVSKIEITPNFRYL